MRAPESSRAVPPRPRPRRLPPRPRSHPYVSWWVSPLLKPFEKTRGGLRLERARFRRCAERNRGYRDTVP